MCNFCELFRQIPSIAEDGQRTCTTSIHIVIGIAMDMGMEMIIVDVSQLPGRRKRKMPHEFRRATMK
jgi:hypothetical protein